MSDNLEKINIIEERIKKLEIDDIWKDERDFNQENRLDIIEEKLIELDEKLEKLEKLQNINI